ncbi:alpha/beta fold hydrolase [Nocardia sp. NPDC051570]|uniref:alpha/beta fold hydrolase n=1 Tax=Nocardia sp. NPDC051570 TaxID=3364324 RepID=UPI00378995E6
MRGKLLFGMSLATVVATVAGLITACGGGQSTALRWCPTIPGHEVSCGVLSRPVVVDRPDLGDLEVSYALVRHSRRDAPAAATIVPNPGGPGGPMIDQAAPTMKLVETMLDDHDLLLIDPRGTGLSGPLDCGIGDERPELETRDQQRQLVARCGERLGARAAGYTSAATADDFDAVRDRLGIPKLVLYGLSYGAYLMPIYAQRHPDHVQSIVLSGAYPIDFDPLSRPSAEAVSLTLHRICERSRACDGDTAVADLTATAARLRIQPITRDGPRPLELTEAKLADLIYETASGGVGWDPTARTPLGMVPTALHNAVRGDDSALWEFVDATTASPEGGDDALGTAVVCNDYATVWSPDVPPAQRDLRYRQALAATAPGEFGAFSAAGFDEALSDGGDLCIRWPNSGTAQPHSNGMPDVPVLVLSGDLDANTPDANGRAAAAQFRRATFVSVPNTGHVPGLEPSGCVTGIVSRFIRTASPGDLSCLNSLPPIAVTPVRN